MESPPAIVARRKIQEAFKVLKDNRTLALKLLDEAFEHYLAIIDDAEKRKNLGKYTVTLDQIGFYDLALEVAIEAIELDKKLNDEQHLAEDIMACGNANLHLNNEDLALKYYKQALEMSLKSGHLNNAASATTNMALIIGNQGNMKEAVDLLYKSLTYLSKMPFPRTEIITRIALSEALEEEKETPEVIFSVARPIVNLINEMHPAQLNQLRITLDDTIRRYLQSHPNESLGEVKEKYLPGIF